jgi:Fe-S cluster assembly ATPase SufC
MKPFVAVIGDRKSGKSTIIRSLTGCPTGSFVGEVAEKVHGKKIYVIAHSLQEKEELPKGESLSAILKKVIKDNNILGIVIAIQPNNPTKKISMENIFRSAQKIGGFSFHTFVINPSYTDVVNERN